MFLTPSTARVCDMTTSMRFVFLNIGTARDVGGNGNSNATVSRSIALATRHVDAIARQAARELLRAAIRLSFDLLLMYDAPPVSGIAKRQIAAVVIGNALEFYDFLTYAFFAVHIGNAFFPSRNPSSSLLLSLATFGAGFLMRPVGGLVIGRMGDRVGRKPAMLLSFSCMGIARTGLALTPTYGSIGIAAPILVIAFRLLQGFALGGEVGPTTAYLMEAAPLEKRGLYASLQYSTQGLAV